VGYPSKEGAGPAGPLLLRGKEKSKLNSSLGLAIDDKTCIIKGNKNESQHNFRMYFCCLVLCSFVYYFNSSIEEYNTGAVFPILIRDIIAYSSSHNFGFCA